MTFDSSSSAEWQRLAARAHQHAGLRPRLRSRQGQRCSERAGVMRSVRLFGSPISGLSFKISRIPTKISRRPSKSPTSLLIRRIHRRHRCRHFFASDGESPTRTCFGRFRRRRFGCGMPTAVHGTGVQSEVTAEARRARYEYGNRQLQHTVGRFSPTGPSGPVSRSFVHL